MGKGISVGTITDNELVNKLQEAAGNAIAEQLWFQRYRNSSAAVAQGVLQFANAALFLTGILPLPVTIAIAIVIIAAEVVVHAVSRTPVTPAVVEKIAQKAVEQDQYEGKHRESLPVYEGPSTA